MTGWGAERIAAAAGARLLRGNDGAPRRVVIDSRDAQPGDLFVGLRGERVDGGAYVEQALRAGAWGVLVTPEHADALVNGAAANGVVLTHPNPLAAMQALAREWRKALGEEGAKVVGITGSTGKTSTKDILAALLGGAEARAEGRRGPVSRLRCADPSWRARRTSTPRSACR